MLFEMHIGKRREKNNMKRFRAFFDKSLTYLITI